MKNMVFVDIGDANDVHTWSGTPFHMAEALTAHFSVEILAPLRQPHAWHHMPRRLWAKLRRRNFLADRTPPMLDSFAEQIQTACRNRDVATVFSSSSIPVSALTATPPAAFWTDACFNAMVDYYDYFRRADATSMALACRQERSALEHCSAAIYASEWAADAARRLHPPAASKIHVVPFGANLDPRYDREKVHALIDARPADKCSLLFVGVDWIRKGGPIALETARLLNASGLETTLTIVGCDPFGAKPPPAFVDVRKFLSLKRSSDRQTLCDLFSTSDFLIVPSRAEAFGIVFCEAAAFGVPAVATATGGIPTIVTDSINGLLLAPSSDAGDYAAAIRKVFNDRGRYMDMARAAYENYAARLNWRIAAAAVSRIIDK